MLRLYSSSPIFHSTSCDDVHRLEWEASAGSSLVSIQARSRTKKIIGQGILDPRSRLIQRWNRAFVLARSMSVAVDPLFFYALSIGIGGAPCLYMDGKLAAVVTILRMCVDAVHLFHLWLQFRLAYVFRESPVVGCGNSYGTRVPSPLTTPVPPGLLVRHVCLHFRYKFANEKLKRTARYCSSNWRTWAAVIIQLAWQKYRIRTRSLVSPVIESGSCNENLLHKYASMFLSIRPHDHLE